MEMPRQIRCRVFKYILTRYDGEPYGLVLARDIVTNEPDMVAVVNTGDYVAPKAHHTIEWVLQYPERFEIVEEKG